MLEILPTEIQLKISGYLPQSDCYHLMLVSKRSYLINKRRLYRSIIIDSKRQYYHKELVSYNDIRKVDCLGSEFRSTVIQTSYGLKGFIRSIVESLEKNGRLIEYLEISKDLPGIEVEVVKSLKKLFIELSNLRGLKFNYHSCFISIEHYLGLIPSNELGFLECDSLKKDVAKLNDLNLLNQLKLNSFNADFLNLNNYKVLNKLEINRSVPTQYPLRFLRHETSYNLKNDDSKDQDLNLENYFKNSIGVDNSKKLTFDSLRLNDFLIKSAQSQQLIDNVNLKSLKSLELIEMSELLVGIRDQEEFELPDNMDPTEFERLIIQRQQLEEDQHINLDSSTYFLNNLNPHLENLQYLALDFYNDFKDSGPDLISSIKDLKQIYFNLRWNQNREAFCGIDFDTLFEQYLRSLSKHSNLKTLLIDSINETKFELIKLDFSILSKYLIEFPKLITLKINLSIDDLIKFIDFTNMNLTNVKFLEVCLTEFNFKRSLADQHFINFEIIKKQREQQNDGSEVDSSLISVATIMTAPNGSSISYDFYETALTQDDLNLKHLNLFKILKEFQIKTNVEYLKIFNVIINLKEFEIKDKGLESWFDDQLKGCDI